jgi:hypothetical protein
VWAVTDNGKNIPLDATPTEDGNIAAHRDTTGQLRARVLRHGDTVAEWEIRGTAHWATCPHADQHRKPKTTRMDRRG